MKGDLLRMGMVGGGPGAFIGDVHRRAARLDGGIEPVAGAFSRDPKKSRRTGRELGLDPRRVYADAETMIEREAALPEDERIDFVTICTPNDSHFPLAKAFLEAGFHVMCEKPMTLTVEEAESLKRLVRKTRRTFGLMHNYVGYPMVKLARDLVRRGETGRIRKVVAEYSQGWLARPIEREGQRQAAWRTDPKRSGAGGCLGDIATHAAHLAEYVTGLSVREVAADLTTFVKGRRLDDDVNLLLRLSKGAKGVLHASQVAVGRENGLSIHVYGEDGALAWHQERPNELRVERLGEPTRVWRRGNDYVAAESPAAARATRLPCGHPEAFIEAFANVYLNFADTIRHRARREKTPEVVADFPGVADGLAGMKFIAAAVRSNANNAAWEKL